MMIMKSLFFFIVFFNITIAVAQPPDYMNLIHKADFQNWENCETGEGVCNKIVLERLSKDQDTFIQVPSGGTAGTCYLYANKQEKPIQTISVSHTEKWRLLDFSDLEDGFYYMSMISCALGGTVQVELKTK